MEEDSGHRDIENRDAPSPPSARAPSGASIYRPFEVAREGRAIEAALERAHEIMAEKGYPTARANIGLGRTLFSTRMAWCASLYLNEITATSELLGFYGSALAGLLALSAAVEGVEPRPREWTLEEIKKTLGVETEMQMAAE